MFRNPHLPSFDVRLTLDRPTARIPNNWAEKASGNSVLLGSMPSVEGIEPRRVDRYVVPPMSDYYAFVNAGIPYLIYTCGRNEHYHMPTDTPDKVPAGGTVGERGQKHNIVDIWLPVTGCAWEANDSSFDFLDVVGRWPCWEFGPVQLENLS